MTPITVGTTGLLTASLSATLPNGLGYVDNGNGTITISGTPAAGTAGSGKTSPSPPPMLDRVKNPAAFSINGPLTFVNGSTDSTTFITTQSTSTFYQIPTTGFLIPTVSVVVGSGSLPAGVTLNASRQLIGKADGVRCVHVRPLLQSTLPDPQRRRSHWRSTAPLR
ncbi:MAG: hypothetical protein U0792_18190 [Gemmataceae bacterium]